MVDCLDAEDELNCQPLSPPSLQDDHGIKKHLFSGKELEGEILVRSGSSYSVKRRVPVNDIQSVGIHQETVQNQTNKDLPKISNITEMSSSLWRNLEIEENKFELPHRAEHTSESLLHKKVPRDLSADEQFSRIGSYSDRFLGHAVISHYDRKPEFNSHSPENAEVMQTTADELFIYNTQKISKSFIEAKIENISEEASDMQSDAVPGGITQSNTMSHGKTQDNIMPHGETKGNTVSHGEIQVNAMSHDETQNSTMSHGETQDNTVSHGKTQSSTMPHGKIKGNAISHGETQNSTMSHNETQGSIMSDGERQGYAISHGEIQGNAILYGDTQGNKLYYDETQSSIISENTPQSSTVSDRTQTSIWPDKVTKGETKSDKVTETESKFLSVTQLNGIDNTTKIESVPIAMPLEGSAINSESDLSSTANIQPAKREKSLLYLNMSNHHVTSSEDALEVEFVSTASVPDEYSTLTESFVHLTPLPITDLAPTEGSVSTDWTEQALKSTTHENEFEEELGVSELTELETSDEVAGTFTADITTLLPLNRNDGSESPFPVTESKFSTFGSTLSSSDSTYSPPSKRINVTSGSTFNCKM
jgi:hypothetical protein